MSGLRTELQPVKPLDADTTYLNRQLIRLSMMAIRLWEAWLEKRKSSMSGTKLDLHMSTIRYTKGVVKCWRNWLLHSRNGLST